MSDAVVKTYITLNPKFYDMVRQMGVKSFVSGFCELITNSVDAYRRYGNAPKPFGVQVLVDRSKNMIQVSDQAIGMSAAIMKAKILEVGSVAETMDGVRGMMGRGAKDISILGDVYFYTIKDGKYSSCTIDRNANQAMLASDQDVTQDQRDKLKIPVNGTVVQIMLTDLNTLPDSPSLYALVSRDYLLRDLFSDPEIDVRLTILESPQIFNNYPVKYVFPDGKQIVKTTFTVPDYPNIQATFTLFKTALPLPDLNNDRINDFGILIGADGDVIYESSCLHPIYRGYKQMKYIYGRIHCNGIRTLMLDAILGNLTPQNPSIMVDPARNDVLNRNHPFVQALLKVPLQWLEIALNQVQDRLDNATLVSDDFKDITDQISQLGEGFVKDNLFQFTWRSKRDDEILQQMSIPLDSLEIDKSVIQMSDKMIDAIKNGDTSYARSPEFTTDPGNDTKPKLKITYVNNQQDMNSYNITTYNGTANLQINTAHPSLSQFLNLTDKNELQMLSKGKATYSIAPVVTSAFTSLMTRDYLLQNPTYFDSANTSTDVFNKYSDLYKNSEASITPDVYKRFYSIIQGYNAPVVPIVTTVPTISTDSSNVSFV